MKPSHFNPANLAIRVAALLLSLFLGPQAASADEFVFKTQVYSDSDNTVVVSPLVHASRDLWKGGSIAAGFVADVVTSASVDVVTNATRRMTDLRKEASGALTQKASETTLHAGYIYSSENDYTSHNIIAGITQDLLQKNTTLGLNYAGSFNDVGRSGDAHFHRSLNVHNIDLSYTQILTRRALLYLGYTLQYAGGYQASPYRFVHIESGPDFKVPETDPDSRLRNAFVAGFKVHLFKDSALQMDYRFYFDDWGVKAHTLQLMYYVDWKYVTLRLRERAYYQSGASFFQSHYTDVQPFVTADRELSTFFGNLAGLKTTFKLDRWVKGFDIEVKLDVFYFQYIDFAYLRNRVGADVGIGAHYLF